VTAIKIFENDAVRKRQLEKQRELRIWSASADLFTRLITNYGTKESTFFRYGFELTIAERQYLFFVNTYEEFGNWTRLFKLIVEMNIRKIPVTLINPFDYE
jgi:hypothetical protein